LSVVGFGERQINRSALRVRQKHFHKTELRTYKLEGQSLRNIRMMR
jgi:hypothetical protein